MKKRILLGTLITILIMTTTMSIYASEWNGEIDVEADPNEAVSASYTIHVSNTSVHMRPVPSMNANGDDEIAFQGSYQVSPLMTSGELDDNAYIYIEPSENTFIMTDSENHTEEATVDQDATIWRNNPEQGELELPHMSGSTPDENDYNYATGTIDVAIPKDSNTAYTGTLLIVYGNGTN